MPWAQSDISQVARQVPRGATFLCSDVISVVPQVVQLQLQLSNFNVLLGKFILQPPQLVLLSEEHPQELPSNNKTMFSSNEAVCPKTWSKPLNIYISASLSSLISQHNTP